MTATNLELETKQFPDWSKIKLSQKQYDFISSDKPKHIVNWSRGCGKSHIVLMRALTRGLALYKKRASINFPRLGPKVIIVVVAPNNTNLIDLWEDKIKKLYEQAKDCGLPIEMYEHSKKIEIFGKTGLVLRLVSGFRPASLRGLAADILICEEFAHVHSPRTNVDQESAKDRGRVIFEEVLLKVVQRPLCEGEIIICSTPAGNYFDDWAKSAREKVGYFKDYEYWHATYEDTPYLTDDLKLEIERERQLDEYKFRQERLAEIHVVRPRVQIGTDYCFEQDIIKKCFVDSSPKNPETGQVIIKLPVYIGIDLAREGNDNLVISIINSDLLLCNLMLYPKTTETDIFNLFQMLHKRYLGNYKLAFDATGEGRYLKKQLPIEIADRSTEVFFYRGGKEVLMKSLDSRLRFGGLKLPNPEVYDFDALFQTPGQNLKDNYKQCINELIEYRKQVETKRNGEVYCRYFNGDKAGDDCVDSLAIVNYILPPIATQVAVQSKEALQKKFSAGLF